MCTGPFACPLVLSPAPLTHSRALRCFLCSRTPLRSFPRSQARSLTPELMGMSFLSTISYSFHPLCSETNANNGGASAKLSSTNHSMTKENHNNLAGIRGGNFFTSTPKKIASSPTALQHRKDYLMKKVGRRRRRRKRGKRRRCRRK